MSVLALATTSEKYTLDRLLQLGRTLVSVNQPTKPSSGLRVPGRLFLAIRFAVSPA